MQARLTSATLFFTLLLAIVALPVPIAAHNWLLLCSLFGTATLHALALFLNRRGQIVFAGIVAVCSINIGLMIAILSLHTLDGYDLPLFDLMVQSVCVAVSLLPPRSVFVVTAANCLFFVLAFLSLPHTAELDHMLVARGYYDAFLKLVTIQLIVAIVTYLWVRSNQKARQRVYFAETIATAEHTSVGRNDTRAVEMARLQYIHAAVERLASQLAYGSVQEWKATGTTVDRLYEWIIEHQTSPVNHPIVERKREQYSEGEESVQYEF